MYLKLMMLIYGLNVVFTITWVLFVFSFIAFIFIIVLHLCGKGDVWESDKLNVFYQQEKFSKWWKRLLVIISVTFLLGVIVSEPKKFIGMAIAYQVDEFILENDEAIYEPQEILDFIDKGIKEIEKFIDKKMEE